MNYQGKITDIDGVAIEDVDRTIGFILYDTETAGSAVWAETLSVSIYHGLFDALLGEEHPFALDFNGQYWMELIVDQNDDGDIVDASDETLAPRQPLSPAAYSYRSLYSDTADFAHLATDDGDWQTSGTNMHSVPDGNIGIGTETPTAKLELASGVAGNSGLRFTNLNSSHVPSVNAEKFLSVDSDGDVVLWDVEIPDGTVLGTGDSNYLSKWIDSLTLDNSIIYDDGSNVGIGTEEPLSKLEVIGSNDTVICGHADGITKMGVCGYNPIGIGVHGFSYGANGKGVYGTCYEGRGVEAYSYDGYGLYASSDMGWAGYFADGNVYVADYVGIGSDNPQTKLFVTGNIFGSADTTAFVGFFRNGLSGTGQHGALYCSSASQSGFPTVRIRNRDSALETDIGISSVWLTGQSSTGVRVSGGYSSTGNLIAELGHVNSININSSLYLSNDSDHEDNYSLYSADGKGFFYNEVYGDTADVKCLQANGSGTIYASHALGGNHWGYGGYFTSGFLSSGGDAWVNNCGVYGEAAASDGYYAYGVWGRSFFSAPESFGVFGEGETAGVMGEGDQIGVIGRGGGVGFGYTSGIGVVAAGTEFGLYSSIGNNYMADWLSIGTATPPAGFMLHVAGNVNITGSINKGSGSFLIDHPLDPLNKTLRHNFVESPENLCIYRGKANLDEKGEAIIQMPDYFSALTFEEEATVVLTPIGRPFDFGYSWQDGNISFIIYGDANREISYLVMADRDDPVIHKLKKPVEEDKGNGNFTPGKLLYPEAYKYPESMGVNYHRDDRRIE